MVTHGKQTNDAIIQTALKQTRFDINLSDISSIDKITLNIHNTLMRDIPPEVKNSHQLQQVMLKSLMHTLSKSKPALFCKDVHIYIQSRPKSEVYDVDTFNTTFNTEACRLIKIIEKDPVEIQVPIRNLKGRIQTHQQLSIELIAMGAESNINHLVD